ncbi:hypothetical protein M2140_000031 [Clostridiales Family XIII bacterium PM5-7]
MDKNNNSNNGRISYMGVLSIVFIVLKLLGKIDWSWFWVLSPIWISVLAVLVIAIPIFIISMKK